MPWIALQPRALGLPCTLPVGARCRGSDDALGGQGCQGKSGMGRERWIWLLPHPRVQVPGKCLRECGRLFGTGHTGPRYIWTMFIRAESVSRNLCSVVTACQQLQNGLEVDCCDLPPSPRSKPFLLGSAAGPAGGGDLPSLRSQPSRSGLKKV